MKLNCDCDRVTFGRARRAVSTYFQLPNWHDDILLRVKSLNNPKPNPYHKTNLELYTLSIKYMHSKIKKEKKKMVSCQFHSWKQVIPRILHGLVRCDAWFWRANQCDTVGQDNNMEEVCVDAVFVVYMPVLRFPLWRFHVRIYYLGICVESNCKDGGKKRGKQECC